MYVESTATQPVILGGGMNYLRTEETTSHSFSQIAQIPLFANLAPMQRVMLLSNGTLTDILQAFTLEEIGVHKLAEEQIVSTESNLLELLPNERVLKRRVVLYGKRTSRHYVYAESLIALGRLPGALARELQGGSEPLGRLQLKHRLETFKELIDIRIGKSERASALLASHSRFLIRGYRVFVNERPCMIIHEHFPTL